MALIGHSAEDELVVLGRGQEPLDPPVPAFDVIVNAEELGPVGRAVQDATELGEGAREGRHLVADEGATGGHLLLTSVG
jgi:hypothetical protein